MATADCKTYWFRGFEGEWIYRNTTPPWEDVTGANPYSWPITQFLAGLHVSSPGGTGGLATNPATYTGYAYAVVPRGASYWTVVGAGTAMAYTQYNGVMQWPKNMPGVGNQAQSHMSLAYDDGGTPRELAVAAIEGGAVTVVVGQIPQIAGGGYKVKAKNTADS